MLTALLALSLAAEPRQAARPLAPKDAGVGRLVPDAAFIDIAGKPGKLSDYKASKLLVVAVTDVGCPVCQKYAPTLAALEAEFADRGVAFLFLNPTPTDAKADIEKAITTHKLKGRYVHDAKLGLAAALGVRSTADVFVLDAARTVAYRGAIDDQYGVGFSLDTPKHAYLKTALTQLLAGKTPDVSGTTAPGCVVETKPASMPVTYHNRVSRLVQQHCQECHRAGGVGPFALDTYEQVVARKGTIRRVLGDGTMPPWFAAAPKDGAHSPFLNDRSLSPADKADLLAWLNADVAKGDPADAPLPKAWPDEWQIGKPDAVFEFAKPVAVKATGTMPYQMVTIDTKLDEDKWVQAVEVRPSAPQVVHHVLVHIVPPGGGVGAFLRGRLAQGGGVPAFRRDVDDERQGFFAAYVPGNSAIVLPDGYAKKLPKGTVLRFQMHYTPNGTAAEDRTRIGLIYAKEPPAFDAKVGAVAQPRISIPPGADSHKEVGTMTVPWDVTVRSLVPHMHVRGKACRYELTTPDGTMTTLLDVPRYDFNWQLRYVFAEPRTVPKGSKLTFTVWYDNSDKNPANPDPTKTVKWGQQTFDEMHLGYIEYVLPRR